MNKNKHEWICKGCNKKFESRRKLDSHTKQCSKYQEIKRKNLGAKDWECKYCHEIFSSRKDLFNHYKECKEKDKLPKDSLGRVKSYTQIEKGEYFCRYCNKRYTVEQHLCYHEKFCKDNPNRDTSRDNIDTVPKKLRKQLNESFKNQKLDIDLLYKSLKHRNVNLSKGAYVYFVTNGNYIKIGFTTNFDGRKRKIYDTIVRLVYFKSAKQALKLELMLHKLLEKYRVIEPTQYTLETYYYKYISQIKNIFTRTLNKCNCKYKIIVYN